MLRAAPPAGGGRRKAPSVPHPNGQAVPGHGKNAVVGQFSRKLRGTKGHRRLTSPGLPSPATPGRPAQALSMSNSGAARRRAGGPVTTRLKYIVALADFAGPGRATSGRSRAPVFATEFGCPVDPRNLLRVVEVAAEKVVVESVGVHTPAALCRGGPAGGRRAYQGVFWPARAFIDRHHW